MKRGLFLLATVTLSSALYAQQILTPEKAREIVGNFNPQLLEQASQDQNISELVEGLISAYLAQKPIDNLDTKYELAALARNFDNSLALYDATQEYQQAVRYSYAAENIEPAARQHAQEQLRKIFSRIWAVSIQIKEELLAQYKSSKFQGDREVISALENDLKNLKTNVGEQIIGLVEDRLERTRARVLAEQTTLKQTSNLQIKTKHKKPVAE
jgi:hypothetical protein